MQGAQNLRSEAYLQVRCNDEDEAQRRRWTFYETIGIGFLKKCPLKKQPRENSLQRISGYKKSLTKSQAFYIMVKNETGCCTELYGI